MRAKQMAEAQRRADQAHHAKRILWLESPTRYGRAALRSAHTAGNRSCSKAKRI